MRIFNITIFLSIIFTLFCPFFAQCRVARRQKRPSIQTSWLNGSDNKSYRLSRANLYEYPIFGWNLKDFESFFLPHDAITYENKTSEKESHAAVSTSIINELIEKTLQELNAKRKHLTYATILQNKNFNRKRECGLLVLKLNDYPFVVKIFKETPQTFVNPYCKGVEPICFFYMGNGANRHLAGFSRLKNRQLILKKLASLEQWKSKVEVPRKWLWLPKKPDWIEIKGSNFGKKKKTFNTVLPGTYAIVADAVESAQNPDLSVSKRKTLVMQLCNDLNSIIDPHFKNFIFSNQPGSNTYKIVILDTEHFPTMIGLTERKQFKDHADYYGFLVRKCFHDAYLQNKANRAALKQQKNEFLAELFSEDI